jgi:hypothetical protein
MVFRIYKIFIFFCLFFCLQISAQDTTVKSRGNERYFKKEIEEKEFDKAYWKKEEKKLNFKEKKKKEQKKYLKPEMPTPSINPLLIKIILYGLLIAFLLFLLIWLGKSGLLFSGKSKKTDFEIDIDHLENEEISEELDIYLKKALENKEYKIAIRIYYLKVLKSLQQQGKIYWKKYKTNRHYENEMLEQEDYAQFKETTEIYEKTWFGKAVILSAEEFESFQEIFTNYLKKLERR